MKVTRKITDEMWIEGRLRFHYQRHRKGHIRLDTSLLEILREREWKRQHALIAIEVCAIVATVLTPPEDLRERHHDVETMLDALRTERVNSEPLSGTPRLEEREIAIGKPFTVST